MSNAISSSKSPFFVGLIVTAHILFSSHFIFEFIYNLCFCGFWGWGVTKGSCLAGINIGDRSEIWM